MACQYISTRFTVLRTFMLAVVINLAAVPAFAAAQLVEVGHFTSAGTITLQLLKFHEQFADGTRIAEITVAEHNGQRVVNRKGYSASGDCRIESAPLLTSNGQLIPRHLVAPAGTRVYLPELIKAWLIGCADDGCRALEGVDFLGHETISARCDQTTLSENRCGCHVVTTETVGTVLFGNGTELCKGSLDRLISAQVSEWIRFRYIE